MALISEQDARVQGLSGSDTFRMPELAYHDAYNRDTFVAHLLSEAYKIFLTSVTIEKHKELQADALKIQNDLKEGKFDVRKHKISSIKWHIMNYINLENFYIASGFELFFKAKLIEKDFLVHEVRRTGSFASLSIAQKTRPILKDDLLSILGYQYDTQIGINTLQGITNKTLNFNLIAGEALYLQEYGLSKDITDIAEDYRVLRNEIHLPGGGVTSHNLLRLGESVMPLIINFINQEVVIKTNKLIDTHSLNREKLREI